MPEENNSSREPSPTRDEDSRESDHGIPSIAMVLRPIRAETTKIIRKSDELFKSSNKLFTKIRDNKTKTSREDLIKLDKLLTSFNSLEMRAGKFPTVIQQKMNSEIVMDHPKNKEINEQADKDLERLDLNRLLVNIRKEAAMIRQELNHADFTISPPPQDAVITDEEYENQEEMEQSNVETEQAEILNAQDNQNLDENITNETIRSGELNREETSESLNTSNTQTEPKIEVSNQDIDQERLILQKETDELEKQMETLKRQKQAKQNELEKLRQEHQIAEETLQDWRNKTKSTREAAERAKINHSSSIGRPTGNHTIQSSMNESLNENQNKTHPTTEFPAAKPNAVEKPLLGAVTNKIVTTDPDKSQSEICKIVETLVQGMSKILQDNKQTQEVMMDTLLESQKQNSRKKYRNENDDYYTSDEDYYNYNEANRTRSRKNQSNHQEKMYPDFKTVQKLIIKFSGKEDDDFQFFKMSFKENVLDNDKFNSHTKYLLLKQSVLHPASEYIQKIEDSQDALTKSLEELEIVYGREDDSLDLHEKLTNFPFNQYQWEEMTKDLSRHRSVIMQLKRKNMNLDDVRTTAPFISKLPSKIKDELVKITKDGLEKLTWQQTHDKVKECIETLKARSKLDRGGSSRIVNEIPRTKNSVFLTHSNDQYGMEDQTRNNYTQHNNKWNQNTENAIQRNSENKSYRIPETGEWVEECYKPGQGPMFQFLPLSFPFHQPERNATCSMCSGPHIPKRCPLSSEEFRKIIRAKKLCANCLVSTHTIYECRSTRRCAYCSGTHHSGSCPKKEYYRDPDNYPKEAKEIVWKPYEYNTYGQPFRNQRGQQFGGRKTSPQ